MSFRLGTAAVLLGTALGLSACSVDTAPVEAEPRSEVDRPAAAGTKPGPDSDRAYSQGAPQPPDVPGVPTGAADALVVNADDGTAARTCDGRSVVVNGDDNALTYTGACMTVTVNGSGNRIAVDEATAVTFNGRRNTVTYRESRPSVFDNDGSNAVSAA
jgi:Protein of unknown function (DUF3060)